MSPFKCTGARLTDFGDQEPKVRRSVHTHESREQDNVYVLSEIFEAEPKRSLDSTICRIFARDVSRFLTEVCCVSFLCHARYEIP